MESDSRNSATSIMHLPDDCLYFIFQRLDCGSDRNSFGLTRRRWLRVQNSSRQSLQFQCSFSVLNISSLSPTSTSIDSFHLQKLLTRFRQLQSLSLSGCINLPDSGLSGLQHYGPKLQALCLDCCFGITDNGLSLVAAGCPSLSRISLYRCNISDVGLEILAISCLALKDIDLSYCSLITDKGIRALLQNCHHLRAVRMSYCRSIIGVGFRGCSQSLSYLEAESCKLEPEGIMGIVSGGGLEYLNASSLSWCIKGDGLALIGCGSATRLRVLNLRLCRSVNDEAVVAIAKGCPLLQEWNLAVCHEVRISGWESIGSDCHNLERLHVNRCKNLCDRGLQALRDGCKRLSTLYISQWSRISTTAIEMFKCFRAGVEIKKEEMMGTAMQQTGILD